MMRHTCNSIYSDGNSRRILSFGPAQAKVLRDPVSKTKLKKKKWVGDIVQVVGCLPRPDFNTQYQRERESSCS
jgi:hypothetical protein